MQGRRSFFKTLGATLGSLAFLKPKIGNAQPQPVQGKVLSHCGRSSSHKKAYLKQEGEIKFILDIPGREVHIKGFTLQGFGDSGYPEYPQKMGAWLE